MQVTKCVHNTYIATCHCFIIHEQKSAYRFGFSCTSYRVVMMILINIPHLRLPTAIFRKHLVQHGRTATRSMVKRRFTVNIYGVKFDVVTYTISGGTTDFNSGICYNANMSSGLYGNDAAYFYAKKARVLAYVSRVFLLDLPILEFLINTASVGYTWLSTPTTSKLLNR